MRFPRSVFAVIRYIAGGGLHEDCETGTIRLCGRGTEAGDGRFDDLADVIEDKERMKGDPFPLVAMIGWM